tara:strand:- start:80 stop:514 length:435 start_codon:yes stop_codon:yes gene_type:complete
MSKADQHIQECLDNLKGVVTVGGYSKENKYKLVRVTGTVHLDTEDFGLVTVPLDTIIKVKDDEALRGWFSRDCYDSARQFFEIVMPDYIGEQFCNYRIETPCNGFGSLVGLAPTKTECDENGDEYYYDEDEYFDFDQNKPNNKE